MSMKESAVERSEARSKCGSSLERGYDSSAQCPGLWVAAAGAVLMNVRMRMNRLMEVKSI
jgi:hypothetical protein